MKATIEEVKEIVSVLTDEQQQVLKDAIRLGSLKDSFFETEDGKELIGYRADGTMQFADIYYKLEAQSTSIFFMVSVDLKTFCIRADYHDAFEQWARM